MSITAITVPKWGIEMQEGTLTEWKVAVGDAVTKGDEIVDMETEKIVNAGEAPASGIIRRLIGEVGDVYEVGVLIGVIADADEDDAAIDAFVSGFKAVDASFEGGDAPSAPAPEPAPEPAATPASSGEAPRISPIAKRLAEAAGLDWTTLAGTGRNGRISKEDVEAALAEQSGGTPIARTATQKTVAARMAEAKQAVPHFYLDIAADVQHAQKLRKDYSEKTGTKVTLNDVIIKAVAVALAEHPNVNVTYRDDELYAGDGGVGVAIASEHGLVAPVISNTAKRTLADIGDTVRGLAKAANARELGKDDLAGGATTVSNLGMFGIDRFTAIINPPQTSILAVGAARHTGVVGDGPAVGGGDGPEGRLMVGATLVNITMSCDHRAFDGADGARFLATLKDLIEKPAKLFDD
ncbi:MAG: dihydrolipoamide acetyltransferase family protein [Pseudomonadota bacterium]